MTLSNIIEWEKQNTTIVGTVQNPIEKIFFNVNKHAWLCHVHDINWGEMRIVHNSPFLENNGEFRQ
jgi:hypothetical protein